MAWSSNDSPTPRRARRVSPVARAVGLLAAGVLILGACTQGGGSSQAPESAAASSAASTEASAGPSGAAGVVLPEPEITDIRLGVNAGSIAGLNTVMPDALDLYSKYGLNVELFEFEGDAQSIQALRAGQIDAGYMSGQPPISSQITSEPLVCVFVTNSKLTDYFVTAPDIDSPEDLVGAQIAVSGLGASSHGQVLLALGELGVDPGDVTITPIGGGSERAAAMLAGSVQAATLGEDEVVALEGEGFNTMLDLADLEGVGIARSALSVPASWVEEYPNTVLALVAASVEAITIMFTDIDTAADIAAERFDMTHEEAVEQIEAEMGRGWYPRDGRPEGSWFELGRDLLEIVDPQFADVDPESAYSAQFVEQLEELGFFEEYGVPAPNPFEP